MKRVRSSRTFDRWFARLRDPGAKQRVLVRVERLAEGNPGDMKPVGGGISEMRIDYGPSYRIYYKDTGDEIIILLCGGYKRTQHGDIADAIKISKLYEEE